MSYLLTSQLIWDHLLFRAVAGIARQINDALPLGPSPIFSDISGC